MSTILLVDDNPDMVEAHRLFLEDKGYEVTGAYSAQEARGTLEALTPDVVVLDVMMEHRTAGLTLAREIHRDFPDLPIILMTGLQDVLNLPFTFEPSDTWLPVERVLTKPVTLEELGREVASALVRKSEVAGAANQQTPAVD